MAREIRLLSLILNLLLLHVAQGLHRWILFPVLSENPCTVLYLDELDQSMSEPRIFAMSNMILDAFPLDLRLSC